jgi:PAS domain S-box-containing protein
MKIIKGSERASPEAGAWQQTADALTAHLQDTIIVCDATGRIRNVFGSYAAVGGWSREQVIGRSVARFIHPLDLATAIGRLMINALDPSVSGRHRLEVRVMQADGNYRLVEVMASNRLSDPELRGIILTVRDIAPRAEAERGRKESEERFKAVTDLSGDIVLIVAADGRILYQSTAVGETLGYTVAERTGGSVFDLIHPEDLPSAHEALRELGARPGRPARKLVELRSQHKDGSWRWLQISGTNLLEHPAVGGLVLSCRDVTARREAEAALARVQARLDAALWGARVGFYTLDLVRDRAEMSPQFFEVTGIDRALWDAGPHPWESHVHQRDRRLAMQRMARHLAGETDSFDAEYRLRTPGGWVWILDRGRIMERDADGVPLTLAGTVIDISARKRLEREIVEIASGERQRLSQDLHDGLGQELTGIALLLRSASNAVKREQPGGAAAADLEQVIRHMNGAIRNARALAHGLHPVRADDGGLAGALERLAANASLAHGLAVSFDAGTWPALSLPTDLADHVYRIAQEALGNAMRHSGASRIAIRLAARGELLELAVCDDGRGLGERAVQSAGLGRRIMNYRAQAIGGGVEWREAAGGGTEVLLQVPFAELQPG